MKEKLFLLTSKRAAARLTSIFDFVWPTAAAIWNLRWQVNGYTQVNPNCSQAELTGRFLAGSGIRGANLRRACIDTSWEEQQQEFARFLLVEFCALYEAWCEGSLEELGITNSTTQARYSKNLQFPTKLNNGAPTKGVGFVLMNLQTAPTSPIVGALHPALSANKKFAFTKLEELLICYRYFKELRNTLIHAGGMVSSKFLDAQTAYKALSANSLGVAEIPEFVECNSGENPKLKLRGIVGFGEIVLMLICTLDAEFVKGIEAEQVLIDRWKTKHGSKRIFIKSGKDAIKNRIKKLIRSLDLPLPVVTNQFDDWLKNLGLIT